MKTFLKNVHTYSTPESALSAGTSIWDSSAIAESNENEIFRALDYCLRKSGNRPVAILPSSVKEELEHYRSIGGMKAENFRKIKLLELNCKFCNVDIESLSHEYSSLDEEIHSILPHLSLFTSKSILYCSGT